MKIKFESINLPAETIQNFAEFLGWKDTSSTTFTDFISEKYGTLIIDDIRDWNLQEARQIKEQSDIQSQESFDLSASQAEMRAKRIITISVE